MNKKIKIIDLFNKIANGEEVPKEIEYQDKIFLKSEDNDYTTDDGVPLVHLLNYNLSNLNDEAEILEDNTEEIEELNDTCYDSNMTNEQKEYYHNTTRRVINELIRAVNEMRKEREDKQ